MFFSIIFSVLWAGMITITFFFVLYGEMDLLLLDNYRLFFSKKRTLEAKRQIENIAVAMVQKGFDTIAHELTLTGSI